MRIILTTVHGTFARDAEWCRTSSTLFSRLVALLGSHSVRVESVGWSGANTIKARYAAGTRIAEHVRTIAAEEPGALHFLIAHSHGGSAAVSALRDPDVQSCVAGIICMSTPFIHCRSSHQARAAGEQFLHALAFSLLLCTLVIGGFAFAIADTLGSVVVVTGLALFFSLEGWFRPTALARGAATAPLLSYPNAAVPLLLVRASGDEASSAIGAGQFAVWASRTLLQWSERATARLSDWVALAVGAALIWVVTTDTLWKEGLSEFLLVLLGGVGLLCILWWLLGAIQGLVLVVPLAATLLSSVAFGWDAPAVVLMSELSVEETPPGEWTLVQLSFAQLERAGLEHSKVYLDSRTPDVVARWIGDIARRDPRV